MQPEDKISTLRGVGPKKAQLLAEQGIETLEDLLLLFPRKYEDRRTAMPIEALTAGREALVCATVLSRRYSGNPYKKNTPLTLTIGDDTGTLEIVFFQGRYVANLLQVDQTYSFYGTVTANFGRLQMIHPEFHLAGSEGDIRGVLPVYPAIRGISQHELRKLQLQLRPLYGQLQEWLPGDLATRYRLADPGYAVEHMHFPDTARQVQESRFRLIFEELLTLETGLFYIRDSAAAGEAGPVIDGSLAQPFLDGLPFALTEGQATAWAEIQRDLAAGNAMNRLVQGDVGSGKTVLAELAMFAAAKSGYQSVMMAPTELLAKQHLQTLQRDLTPYGLRVGLLCSSMKASEKRAVLRDLADGAIQILTGTHAVLQPEVQFQNLGLVITDEQHRFGVRQRSLLTKKGENPNTLVMTATPIPRTLAVVLYGDLDISQIHTMPGGRIPIRTTQTDGAGRARVYAFVKRQLEQGRQAYVVAPLIENSEHVEARSAEEVYASLRETFAGFQTALVHGNMKQEEKDAVMEAFAAGAIHVLVSTVVIEVGINVPNAAVMVIENAERFGLAQLHQLRGRVGRGAAQSYCFLIREGNSDVAKERCEILCSTTDGFAIAEADLRLRGPGEIFGTRQHGLPQLQLSDLIRHGDVLEKAKDAARSIIEADPRLRSPAVQPLKRRVQKMFGEQIRLEL